MSIIKIENPGGLAPSVLPRALPPHGAQVAHNVLAGVGYFHPLLDDSTVAAGGASVRSLYRLARRADASYNQDPATGWVLSDRVRSYSKYQLNDDLSERTAVTTDDGTQAARVVDARGQDRLLGVPAPVRAPAVGVKAVDEFTAEKASAAVGQLSAQVGDIIKAAMQAQWVGDEVMGEAIKSSATIPRDAPWFAQENRSASDFLRLYGLSTLGMRTVRRAWGTAPDASFDWVFDQRLGGFEFFLAQDKRISATNPQPAPLSPPPGTDGDVFWAIPFAGRAKTCRFDLSTIKNKVQTLKLMEQQVFTEAQAQTLVDNLRDWTVGETARKKMERHRAKTQEVADLLSGANATQNKTSVQAFYQKSDVQAEIDRAVEAFAQDIWGKLYAIQTAGDSSTGPDGLGH